MRVALFSETYPPQRNGVAILLDRLVTDLSRRGFRVLVVTARDPRLPEPEAPPPGVVVRRVAGVPLFRYPDLRIAAPWSRRIRRELEAFGPDVVHLATEFSVGLLGRTGSRRLGVPAVASFHTDIPAYLPYYGFGWLRRPAWAYLRWFHRHAHRTYCPSEPVRRELLDRGFRDVGIWGRGVDARRFSPARRSAGTRRAHGPPEALHLLYVGRLTPEKDLPVLFEAFREASAAAERPLHLVVTGNGAYASAVRAAAPERVTFTGYVEGDALARTYASADVFVFPSRTETLGNAVLEAMASGLPVVAPRAGGVTESVEDGVNGLLFPSGDPGAMARSILTLAEDVGLRATMSRNARKWAERRSWEAAFDQLVAGYREAAPGRS